MDVVFCWFALSPIHLLQVASVRFMCQYSVAGFAALCSETVCLGEVRWKGGGAGQNKNTRRLTLSFATPSPVTVYHHCPVGGTPGSYMLCFCSQVRNTPLRVVLVLVLVLEFVLVLLLLLRRLWLLLVVVVVVVVVVLVLVPC